MQNKEQIRAHLEQLHNLVKKCKDDKFKELIIHVVKNDWRFFFDTFLFTYDPRKKIKTIPFVLYDFQVELITAINDAYENRGPLLVEKSRDMGFSWCFLGWITWKFITEDGFNAGIGSHKLDAVDKLMDMKSLMQRVRFMLGMLPKFLLPNFDERKHSKQGHLFNPDKGSYITGEGGDNIGRGDRTSIYFLDEFAHIPRSSIVHEAVGQTTDVLIYGSTPKGRGNEFARLRWNTNIKIQTLHWRRHPNKDQAWYDKMCELLTPEQIAQELDISYAKSQSGRVYKWFDALKHANEKFDYNPNYDLYITSDWGIGDPTACLFIQYYKNIVHIVDYIEDKDKNIEEIIALMFDKFFTRNNLSWNNIAGWYGDPDGGNRDRVTGDSIKSYLSDKYGINLRFKYPNHIKPRVLAVNLLGKANRIRINSSLTHVIDCMENYRYPEKEHGENEKPLHDWTSHICSALEYYCVYEHGMDQFRADQCITSVGFR